MPPEVPSRERSPVFVFGALRSGTTVFRLMLDAHGEIRNPGEVDFLFDHLARDPSHPTGWRYRRTELADDRIFQAKALTLPEGCDGLDLLHHMIGQLGAGRGKVLTLNVHRHADRLVAVLPQTRIIHMLRDPRDVARSSIGMGWAGTLYHGVDHWMRSEEAWDRAQPKLSRGQVLTLTFEGLLADTTATLAEVCAFLEVPYSPRMLDYHRSSTYAPPDRKLAEQWRSRAGSREIDLLEGKAGTMMRARGYAPAGPGARPGLLEGRLLHLKNRTAVWRHGMRLFGPGVFLSEKVTRYLGLSGPHRYIRQRMHKQVIRQLK